MELITLKYARLSFGYTLSSLFLSDALAEHLESYIEEKDNFRIVK